MPDNFLEALDEKEEGEKRYHKSNFRPDELRDAYICPEGEEGKRIYKKRGYTVESVFGQIKWDGRKPSMYLRGLVKARGEFSVMCLVHNFEEDREESARGHGEFPWEV